MKNPLKVLKRSALFAVFAFIYVMIIKMVNITCPILAVTGIPCPTCGVTRALFSLLRGDFEGYFKYHPLAVPLVFSVLLLINADYFKHRKTVTAISLSIVVLNFPIYLCKLIALRL